MAIRTTEFLAGDDPINGLQRLVTDAKAKKDTVLAQFNGIPVLMTPTSSPVELAAGIYSLIHENQDVVEANGLVVTDGLGRISRQQLARGAERLNDTIKSQRAMMADVRARIDAGHASFSEKLLKHHDAELAKLINLQTFFAERLGIEGPEASRDDR